MLNAAGAGTGWAAGGHLHGLAHFQGLLSFYGGAEGEASDVGGTDQRLVC